MSRLRILRDALARVIRTQEALQDGDGALAEQLLEDLTSDLWQEIERHEREVS